jgi:hypothetical protein
MIRFIDLTKDYYCSDDLTGLPPAWAFLNPVTSTFLTAGDGTHLFTRDDINEHPQAVKLTRLAPPLEPVKDIPLPAALANAIIDMDNHGYSESLGPDTERAADAWDELVREAEEVVDRKADAHWRER